MNRYVFFFFFSFVFIPCSFLASLNFSHSSKVKWSANGSQNYDCFDTQTYEQLVDSNSDNFYIKYSNGEEAFFFVTFSEGNSGGGQRILKKGGNELAYDLYKFSGQQVPLKDKPFATEQEVLSGEVIDQGPPRKVSQSYYFVVVPGQIVPKGTYKDRVKLRLYEGLLNGSHQFLRQKNIQFQVKVPELLKILIGPQGGSLSEVSNYNVDFGTLEEGKEKKVEVNILSNTGYELLLRSDHRGYLRHSEYNSVPSQDLQDHKVSYSVDFDGNQVALQNSGNQLVETRPQQTTIQGDTYLLEVRIGDVDQKMHGDYRDVLTLTARAL